MSEQQSVLLFGRAGCGKSSIANMLVQGDIYQNNNVFTVNDSAGGETLNTHTSCSDKYQIFDTVLPYDPISRKNAIRNYFASIKLSLNYLFYVQKKGRIGDEDKKAFKLFREIFKWGEENFVIIITNSNPKWVEKNLEAINESFGKYPIISVDFPLTDNEDDDTACKDRNKRVQSLQRLENKLVELNHKSIKLEVLNSTQKTEKDVSQVVKIIPVVGTAYQLISSGVYYYTLEKPNNAKERLIDGAVGLALDAMSVAVARASKSVSAALFKDVFERITYEACKRNTKRNQI